MHMAAVLERGFNEDFWLSRTASTCAVQPTSLLQGDEPLLMVKVAALAEALRTGTTTIVEIAGGIKRTVPDAGGQRAALRVRRVCRRR